MSNILFVGKDLPDCIEIVEGMLNEKKVYTSAKKDLDLSPFNSEGIYSFNWNRSSAISSRSLIINAETTLENLNQYVIYFDSVFFNSKYELDRTENVSSGMDMLFTGYQFFLNELILRLEQKKDPCVISFVVRTYPSKYESFHTNSKALNLVPTSNIVNAAQSAFISLAENISTQVAEKPYLSVLLSKCEVGNELYNDEKALGSWISTSMDVFQKSNNHQSIKQSGTWVKAGSKVSAGFSLFK